MKDELIIIHFGQTLCEMITAERYLLDRRSEWNAFVASSRNGTFLFNRSFMDYHSDRFVDYSLMFYDSKHRLVALLPANIDGQVIYSHDGLTYGGLIFGDSMRATVALEVIQAMNDTYKNEGIKSVVYKPTPWIYHRQATEEDLYAIFRLCDYKIISREISTVVNLAHPLPMSELRRRHASKAYKIGVKVGWNDSYTDFWKILYDNLMHRFGVHPVHTLDEILLLASSFPDNIRLCTASLGNETVAGAVLFLCGETVHVQYISASAEGKKIGALDAIFSYLISHYSGKKRYFDFGKSTEDMGHYLNEGLIFQKEGFGGRGVCYDTYEWRL